MSYYPQANGLTESNKETLYLKKCIEWDLHGPWEEAPLDIMAYWTIFKATIDKNQQSIVDK